MTPRPDRAVVLAAGFGTRMRPLTRRVPKPLLPLWGVPMLEHILRMLRRWGVRHVLLNLHHRADALLDFARGRVPDGLALDLSFEPEILGTGGALRRAAWFPGQHPFWMINADVAADLDPGPLLRAISRPDTDAALWMHPDRGPRTVEMQDDVITDFRSRRPGAAGTCTFCGLHLIHPRLLARIPEGFSSVIEVYEAAQAAGRTIRGVVVPEAYWRDIGTPEDYLAAHAETLSRRHEGTPGGRLVDPSAVSSAAALARHGITVRGFAAVARDAALSPGAQLRDSVVWSGAHVGGRARLDAAIVAGGAHVNAEASDIVMAASDVLASAECAAIERLGERVDFLYAECLAPRGSARSFIRLAGRARPSRMLIRYSLERRENALFARHARLLESIGVRAPRVHFEDARRHFLLVEDLGRISLERIVREGASAARLRRLYQRALEAMHRMHSAGLPAARRARHPLMPGFGPALYRWEHALFEEQVLRGVLGYPPGRAAAVVEELRLVPRRLRNAPRVLLHRDLQSSNVMILRNREAAFIDFQGMRAGPAAYDLASLLFDPYVNLPRALRDELASFYATLGTGAEAAARLLEWAAVQRLVQALGAFARLARLPGGARYHAHLHTGAALLRGVVEELEADMPRLARALDRVAQRPAPETGNAG